LTSAYGEKKEIIFSKNSKPLIIKNLAQKII
jgi:hypothetical protein